MRNEPWIHGGQFWWIDEEVFEGILSIQRFSIWPNTEIFSYNKIFIAHYACKKCRFEFGTTKGFIFQIINSLIESWGGAGGGYAWPTLTVFVNCKLFLLNFFFCLHRPSLNSLVSCGQYFCFIMWFFIKFCCCCFSWCPWMTSYYLITSWTSLILLPGLFFIIQHLKQLGTGSFYF